MRRTSKVLINHHRPNICNIIHFADYKPRADIVWSRWETFPIFFGMMTGAYEGLGTVSTVILFCMVTSVCVLIKDTANVGFVLRSFHNIHCNSY